MIWKVQIYHQHIVDNIMIYIPKGNYLTSLTIYRLICIKNWTKGQLGISSRYLDEPVVRMLVSMYLGKQKCVVKRLKDITIDDWAKWFMQRYELTNRIAIKSILKRTIINKEKFYKYLHNTGDQF